MYKRYALFWFGLIIALYACPVQGAVPVSLDPASGRINVAGHMDILEDTEGDLTFDQVSSKEYGGFFTVHREKELNVGHSRSTYWMRFKLKRTFGDRRRTWFFEAAKPGIGEIDLYVPLRNDSGVHWLVKRTGADRPWDSKDVLHRSYVLEIQSDFDEDSYFYLRIKSIISINLALLVWAPAEYVRWTVLDFYGFGAVYGCLLAMIIYNLIVFIYLREIIYLYYVLYISSIFCYFQFIFGQAPAFISFSSATSMKLLWITAGCTWIFSAAFFRAFLNTRVNTPRADKLVPLVTAGGGLLIVLGLSGFNGPANIVNNVLSLYASALAIVVAIVCMLRGFKPARYFLMAWIVLLVGQVLYVLGGVVITRTFVTRYTVVIGVAVESLILSLALAARIRTLRIEKEKLAQRENHFKELSRTDGLTGLYNKRYMVERLAGEADFCRRNGRTMSVLMIDVDGFKAFNDAYGHPEGDKVLRALAGVIKDNARQSDIPCRYGGEEFALILPGASEKNATDIAERIRHTFSNFPFHPKGNGRINASVSIGLSEINPTENPDLLIERADQALYKAKRKGKNRVVAFAEGH